MRSELLAHLTALTFSDAELSPVEAQCTTSFGCQCYKSKSLRIPAVRGSQRALDQTEHSRETRPSVVSGCLARDDRTSAVEQAIVEALADLLSGAAPGYLQALRYIADDPGCLIAATLLSFRKSCARYWIAWL